MPPEIGSVLPQQRAGDVSIAIVCLSKLRQKVDFAQGYFSTGPIGEDAGADLVDKSCQKSQAVGISLATTSGRSAPTAWPWMWILRARGPAGVVLCYLDRQP